MKKTQTINIKFSALIISGMALATILWLYGPIPQSLSYHNFADQREIWRIPNFNNVISNFLFFIIGMNALIAFSISRTRNKLIFINKKEIRFYIVFFLGIFLVSLGSAYYHWNPNNTTLVWDRLPMTISFMSLFAAIIAERIQLKLGLTLLPILLFLGLLSIIYWNYSESFGHGDLRPYIFVQLYPMFAIPMLLIMFKAPYTQIQWLWYALALYLIAKVMEGADIFISNITNELISGHSLKHIFAATGCYCIWIYLISRKENLSK